MKRSIICCANVSCLPLGSTLHPPSLPIGTEADLPPASAGFHGLCFHLGLVGGGISRRLGRRRKNRAVGVFLSPAPSLGITAEGLCSSALGPSSCPEAPLWFQGPCLPSPLRPLAVAGRGERPHPCGLLIGGPHLYK